MSSLFYLFGGNPERITKEAIRESRRATLKIEVELRLLDRERTQLEQKASAALSKNRKHEAFLFARQIVSLNARVETMIQSTIHLGQVSAQSAAVLTSHNTLRAVAKTSKAAERVDRLFDNSSVAKDVKSLQMSKIRTEQKHAQVEDMLATTAEGDAEQLAEAATEFDDDDNDGFFGNTPEAQILMNLPGGHLHQIRSMPDVPLKPTKRSQHGPISDSSHIKL